jgi:3-oxoacyl-(acyl-carrier-protein) synthase
MTVSHKEGSGLAALVDAVDILREGKASSLIAGGTDAVFETFFKAHDRFGVMSPSASFSSKLAPFDAAREGFVLGEGAVSFWLERSDATPEPGRRGEILGVAASSASVPLNAWPDRPDSLERTMKMAMQDAGLAPSDVDVVYASANATRELDRCEAQALTSLFGGTRTVVTTIKGALGESGASGALACAAACLCGPRVPPVAGLSEPDRLTASLRLACGTVDAPGPIVLVNSFASGGALFSAVLRIER